MKKIYAIFLLVAFGLSISAIAQITGDYKGTAYVKSTLLGIDETIEDAVVTLKASGSEYCLEVQEMEMGGTSFPAFEFCGITATQSGANYTLTAAPVSIIIPELTIPPIPPYFPTGGTFYNVPVTIKLTNGLVAGNTLTLKIEVTATLMVGPIPLQIPITLDYSGTKAAAPFEGDGTENNPYLIYNELDLSNMANLVNANETCQQYRDKYYKVMNNIDLTMYASNGWYPIGFCLEFPFSGHFNGNNKKITNMRMIAPLLYNGLFGCLWEGTIANLEIENAEIDIHCECPDTGEFFAGIVVGYVGNSGNGKPCSITNCSTSGKVSCSTGQKTALVGGIAGLLMSDCSISACYTTATVSCTSEVTIYVGGVVGAAINNNTISHCYAKGEVSGTSNSNTHVGGIAGILSWGYANIFPYGDNCTISDCFTTGKIVATALSATGVANAGGVVGVAAMINSAVSNSYSISEVKSSAWMVRAGGVAGARHATISNCAALNPKIVCVVPDPYFGRIAGSVWDDPLINNIGFSDMLNPDGETIWLNKGLDKRDGEDFTAEQINADGTLGGRFMSGKGGWTTQNGYLPGLFGKLEPMPDFLKPNGITSTTLSNPIQVYPNPTSGQLTIDNGELTIENVEIFDMMGKKIFEEKDNLTVLRSYDLTLFPTGIYFLKITTEQGMITKKIIKN